MAGLVPAIHGFSLSIPAKAWMPGTRPGMTRRGRVACIRARPMADMANEG